jgi:ankyrin repeat protein
LDREDSNEVTPLRAAVINGNKETIKYLLKKGADINYQTKKGGYTALMQACWSSTDDVIEFLLKNGADINIKSKFNRTAAEYATRLNKPEGKKLKQILIRYGDKI